MSKASSKFVITAMASAVGALLVAGKACATDMNPNEVTVTELTCAAINNAIRSLPASGGTVRLIEGTYNCTEPLAIERDNVAVIGAGKSATILLSDAKAHIPVLVIGVMKTPATPGQLDKYKSDPVHTNPQFYPEREVRNITVENLTVDGNRLAKGQQAQGEFECYIPAGEQSSDGKVVGPAATRCDGDNGKWVRVNAITVRRASDVRILHVAAKGAESGGLTVEKGSSRLFVDGFESSGNIFDGFAGYETDQSIFRNMYLHDNTSSGISIDFNFNDNTFENLVLVKNNDNGVFSHSVSGNKYINVTLRDNKNFGFWIDGWRTEEERPWASGDFKNARTAGCDRTEIRNVKAINSKNDIIRMNYPCRDVQIEDVRVIKSLVPNLKDCVMRDGGTVSITGKYQISCQVKPD